MRLRHLDGLEALPALKVLEPNGCATLRKPRHRERLPALETLNIMGCRGLKELKGLEKISTLLLLRLGWKFSLSAPAALRDNPDLKIEQRT